MNSSFLRLLSSQLLLREILTLLLSAALMLQSAIAAAPAWWSTRSVLVSGAAADDYVVANLGQLKAIAKKAAQEMNAVLPGGAGSSINDMINSWTNAPAAGITRDDYAALTLGQLKTIAEPFYDRLAAVNPSTASSYPWTGIITDDYVLANLGQLKAVFSFDIVDPDSNHNGIPDAWELMMFGDLNQSITGDFDEDGLNNRDEFLAGTDARVKDSDGDGADDNQEVADGTDPKNARSVDSDRDGVFDAEDAVPYDDNFTHPKSGMPNYVVMDLGLCEGGFIDMADNGTLLWRETLANGFGISMLQLWSPTMTATVDVPWNYISSGPEDSAGYANLTGVTSEGLIIGGSRQIIPTQAGTPIYETRHFTLNATTGAIAWMPRSYPEEEGTRSQLYWEYLGGGKIGPGDKFFGSSEYQFWPSENFSDGYFKVTQFSHTPSAAEFEGTAPYYENTPALPTTAPGSSGYPGQSFLIGTEYENNYNQYVVASGAGAVIITERNKHNVYKVAQYDNWPEPWDMGYWTYGTEWDSGAWPIAHSVYLENIRTCKLRTASESFVLDTVDTVTATTSNFVYFGGVSPEAHPWVSYNEDNYVKNTWNYLDTKSYLYKPNEDGTGYERAAIYAKKEDYPATPIESIGLITPRKQALVWGKYDPDNPTAGVQALWADGGVQPMSKLINGYDNYTEWSIEDVSQDGMLAATAKKNSDGKTHMLVLAPLEIRDVKELANLDDDVLIEPKKDTSDTNINAVAWIEPHKKKQDADPDAYEDGDGPRMPQLEVQIKGLPATVNVLWKFKCTYKRPGGRDIPGDQEVIPQDGSFTSLAGNQPWIIYQEYNSKPFFGGEAELTYKVLNADGSVMVAERTEHFRIAGKNPSDDRCRKYLDKVVSDLQPQTTTLMWYAYAIAKSETKYEGGEIYYNQFLANGIKYPRRQASGESSEAYIKAKWDNGKGREGVPNWNDDGKFGKGAKDSQGNSLQGLRKPGGYGIKQVTGWNNDENGDVPRAVIWNWQINVDEGLRELVHHHIDAREWMLAQRNVATKPLPPLTVENVTFSEGTARTMDDAVAMKNYNGHSICPSPDPDIEPAPKQFFYTGRKAKRGRFCYWDNDVKEKAWRLSRYNGYSPPFVYVKRVCLEIEP